MVHTTIAQNSAVAGTNGIGGSGTSGPGTKGSPGMGLGGGVTRTSGLLWLRSSALSANTSGGNGYGTITDGGYNLSSDLSIPLTGTSRWLADPLLGGLADNGGPTKTMALRSASPALDKVPAAATPPTDQRGLSRPIHSLGDIGAYEAGFFVSGTVALGATGLANVAVMAGTNLVLTDLEPDGGEQSRFLAGDCHEYRSVPDHGPAVHQPASPILSAAADSLSRLRLGTETATARFLPRNNKPRGVFALPGW